MMIRYSKSKVVKLAKEKGLIFYDERTIGNWLDDIVNILTSERAQNVLEWKGEYDQGDYFLNLEMNITNERNKYGKMDYSYNLITSITLALLLTGYKEDYFESLSKDIYASEKDGVIWIEKLETEIEKFKELWEDEGTRNWEVIKMNIFSQLYKLTLPRINEDIITQMEVKIQNITDDFLSMSDDCKIRTYKKIEKDILHIEKKINKVIDDMDNVESFEYKSNLQMRIDEIAFLKESELI